MDSPSKNENAVINYSLSSHSKPTRPSIIFVTQMKVFLIKYETILTLHRQQSKMFKAQKCSKGIVKMVHVTEFHFWVN